VKHLRFSLGALMGLVSLVAISFAALRSTSLLWASATFTATVVILSVASLGAFAARGTSRLPWLGFAAFGWVYLLTTFWLWPGNNGVTAPPFLPKLLMDYAVPQQGNASFVTMDRGPQGEMSRNEYSQVPGVRPAPRIVHLHHYRRIGHTLTAILVGILGALLGRFFATRREAVATGES
jgi:hypothetical protein